MINIMHNYLLYFLPHPLAVQEAIEQAVRKGGRVGYSAPGAAPEPVEDKEEEPSPTSPPLPNEEPVVDEGRVATAEEEFARRMAVLREEFFGSSVEGEPRE